MSKAILKDKKQYVGMAIMLIIIIVFSAFVYIPQHQEVSRLNNRIGEIEDQIALTNAMLGGIEKLGPVLGHMQQEMKLFEKRLPTKKQISSIVSELSSLAQSSGLELVSIKSEKPIQVLDKEGRPVHLDKRPLDSIKIYLELRTSYKALAEYIKKIQDSLNILAGIDGIMISRKIDTTPKLMVGLTLTVYVIGER